MPINSRELALRLSNAMEEMLAEARALGDETTALALEHQLAIQKKGLVRIALVGNTSSGKSTIVNALLKQMVVPENPSVCSPVPVWIHYHVGNKVEAEVVRCRGNEYVGEQVTLDTFMTEYCYNVSDMTNVERVRFKDIAEASIAMENDILSTGAILIDTLGIAATAVDTAKTLAVLNEGVDLVVFAFANESGEELLQSEVQFLREHILGYEPEKRRVNYPLNPRNLIFVYNDFSGQERRDYSLFADSTKRLFLGTDQLQTDAEHKAWVKTNIFDVQALYARLLRCDAPYPYSRLAPKGSSEAAKEDLVELEDTEAFLLGQCKEMSGGDKDGDFGFAALEKGLRKHVLRRSVGRESVALNRIRSLQLMLDQISAAANNRIKSVAAAGSELQALQHSIGQIRAQIDTGNATMQKAINQLRGKYISSFNHLFTAAYGPTGTSRGSCKGMVLQFRMPDSFRDEFDLAQFKNMSDAERVEFLNPYVNEMVDKVTDRCRSDVLKALHESRGSATGVPVPLDVLEESRVYVTTQANSLNEYISTLEEMNVAGKLGVMLPAQGEVESFFISLQTDLEGRLLQAISDALANGKSKFNAQRANYIGKVSGGFFDELWTVLQAILAMGRKSVKDVVWDNVRKRYLTPLVDCSLDALSSFNEPGVSDGLYQAVTDAYQQVLMEIVARRTGIVVALEQSYQQVEGAIQTHGAASPATLNEMDEILKTCDALKKELTGYQTELLRQG